MSLLFNMLSRFVIVFLPRSKCLLISWVQSTICSDFGAQENNICHCFHFSPSICHEVIGLDAKILPWLYWGPQNCDGHGGAQHFPLWQEPKTESSLYEKLSLLLSGLTKMLKTQGTVDTQKCGDSHTRWTEPWWYPHKATSPDTPGVSFLSPSCPDILVLYIRCTQRWIPFSPQLGINISPFFKNSL